MLCAFCREVYERGEYRDACVHCGAPRELAAPIPQVSIDSKGLALTRNIVDTVFYDMYHYGVVPKSIVTGPFGARKIDCFYEGYTVLDEYFDGSLHKKLMEPVSGFTVEIVIDRNCPPGTMYFMDTYGETFGGIDNFSESC
jgi:hypothetical protein